MYGTEQFLPAVAGADKTARLMSYDRAKREAEDETDRFEVGSRRVVAVYEIE